MGWGIYTWRTATTHNGKRLIAFFPIHQGDGGDGLHTDLVQLLILNLLHPQMTYNVFENQIKQMGLALGSAKLLKF